MPRLPLPDHIKAMPPGKAKAKEISRFYVKLTALYAHRSGTIRGLSTVIPTPFSTLKAQVRGILPMDQKTRQAINSLIGDKTLPPKLPVFHREVRKRRNSK